MMPDQDPVEEAKLLGKMVALTHYAELVAVASDPVKRGQVTAKMAAERDALRDATDKTDEQKIAWANAYTAQLEELTKKKWLVEVKGQVFETESRETVLVWIDQGRVLKETPLMDPDSDEWRSASEVFAPWPKAGGCFGGLVMMVCNFVR